MSDRTFWSIAFMVWVYASAAMLLAPMVWQRTGRKPLVTLAVLTFWLPLYGIAYLMLAVQRVTGGQR
jgi:hypothetical protein